MSDATVDTTDPLIGAVLEERYRVVKKLGQGGMGAVYRGEHLLTKRQVAIKVLLGGMATSPEVVARFQREAQAATAIGHPNIVEVLDMGRLPAGPLGGGSLYMVLEFLEGRDLNDLVEAEGILPIARAAKITTQLCQALHAAHEKGIVHRDVKPENVFLVRRGDDADFVKVLDFGISKMSESAGGHGMTQTGSILGTPYYLSPEQAHGKRDLDRRADIYAVGVLLYRILTGVFPFEAESFPLLIVKICSESPTPPRRLRPELPPELESLVMRCLEKTPSARFATAHELAVALAPFVTLPTLVTPPADALARTAAHTAPMAGSVPITAVAEPVAVAAPIRAAAPVEREPAPHAERQSTPYTSAAPPPPPAARSPVAIAIGAAVVAGLAAIGWIALGSSSSPGASPPAEVPALVRIRVTTTPARATLRIDGEEVPNPYDAELPPSRDTHTLAATAPGHRDATRIVAFSETRDITLELVADAEAPTDVAPAVTVPAEVAPPVAETTEAPADHRRPHPTSHVDEPETPAEPVVTAPDPEPTPEPTPEPEPEGAGHAIKRIRIGGP